MFSGHSCHLDHWDQKLEIQTLWEPMYTSEQTITFTSFWWCAFRVVAVGGGHIPLILIHTTLRILFFLSPWEWKRPCGQHVTYQPGMWKGTVNLTKVSAAILCIWRPQSEGWGHWRTPHRAANSEGRAISSIKLQWPRNRHLYSYCLREWYCN